MKKINRYLQLLMVILAVSACSDDGFVDPVDSAKNPEELPWKATTSLEVSKIEGKEDFVWVKNLLTNYEYWGTEKVEYQVDLKSAKPVMEVNKVEFYVSMQEQDGYNFSAPFDYEGKLAKTVNQWDEQGQFMLSFEVGAMYDLFLSELKHSRNNGLAREGDVFEVHWVIYGNDGEVVDSREQLGADKRFSFRTKLLDFAPPIWAGTFNYEWIDATPNGIAYGRIAIGQTGTVTITQDEGQVYSMENLMFGYYYAKAGKIYFDFLSGLVYVEGIRGEKWTVTKVEGPVLEIALEYQYSASYNEYCTVRVTRTDGLDWPANIHTE